MEAHQFAGDVQTSALQMTSDIWEEFWTGMKAEALALHERDQDIRRHDAHFLAVLSSPPGFTRYQADPSAFQPAYRKSRLELAIRELQDAIFEVARNVFGNGISRLGIDPYDYADYTVSGHDDEDLLKFDPVALWNAISRDFGGEAGKAIANHQLAEALVSKLISYQEGEVPERKGKFVLTRSIFAESTGGGTYRLSYNSLTWLCEVFDLLAKVALLTGNEEAETDIKRIANRAWRCSSSLSFRSRDTFTGQFGEFELVLFKSQVEFRLSPRFTEALNIFVAENGYGR